MLHFLTTGPNFPYAYYIGVKSASLVGEVKLWYSEKPNTDLGNYWNKIVKEVPTEEIFMPDEDFFIFHHRYDTWCRVSKFGYLIWKIIAKHGGTVMGLDSITLKAFDDLLGDADMLVGRDAEDQWPTSYCMHGATCKKDSFLAQKIFEDSERAMRGEETGGPVEKIWRDGYIRFGAAGIIPMLNNIAKYKDKVKVNVADYGVLGGYRHDGSPFYLFEKGQKLLNLDARTIPFYATWQHKKFDIINPETIKGTLLGDLVERLGI